MTVQLAGKKVGVALDQRQAKRLFAGKVVIKRALGHADAAQDFIQPGGGEAFFGEGFQPGAQQELARVGQRVARLGRAASAAGGHQGRCVHIPILD